MRYFVGLDVGHRTTSISVIDQDGERVRDDQVATEPKAIANALSAYRRGCVRVGIEACSVSVWLAPKLAKLRLPVVCIEARHAHQVLKANINKTDRNDARGIAQLVRTGMYRVVHLKSPETRHIQTMLTVRRLVLAKSKDIENAIGGIMQSFGLQVPRGYLKDFQARVRAALRSNTELRRIIEPLLELRAALLTQFERVDADVRAVAEEDPICKRLMTAPGVGPIVAVTYRAVIDVPERFRRSQTVGAHLGLTHQEPSKPEQPDIEPAYQSVATVICAATSFSLGEWCSSRARVLTPCVSGAGELRPAAAGEKPSSPWRGGWR